MGLSLFFFYGKSDSICSKSFLCGQTPFPSLQILSSFRTYSQIELNVFSLAISVTDVGARSLSFARDNFPDGIRPL